MPSDFPDLSPIFYGPASTGAFPSSHLGRFKLVWRSEAKKKLGAETASLSGGVEAALTKVNWKPPALSQSIADMPPVTLPNVKADLRPKVGFECASMDAPEIPAPVPPGAALWLDHPDPLTLDVPDADFLTLLLAGSLVDLGEAFGGFLLDAGLGSIPVVHTFRALFQTIKAGINLGVEAYDWHQMSQLAERVKLSNAYGGPSWRPENEAFRSWFREGLTEINKTNTAHAGLSLGSYALDTGLSLVDPTPISGVLMSASRIAAKVYTLYRQWSAVVQVNSILADSTKWDPIIFAKCPVLFSYLFRLQYRDVGQPTGAGTAGRRGAIYTKSELVRWETINSVQAKDCEQVLTHTQEFIDKSPFELVWVSTSETRSLPPQPLCIYPKARPHD